ncbi:hypothetical protein TRIP_B250285 [uncultured Desulfatiglans sp.]|uniref:Uncharacterized protein n=1 Tax=Uncultured Desulfatiglans sp. TaxID=1748965 RepID=A0A653A6C2_UNCDX|nr:hypothetical protein TRIP_B250285 [uncultured Desulfatiglans sp.]
MTCGLGTIWIPSGSEESLRSLRVLSPTPAGRVPVSSHPSGAQSHRFAAGPGFFTRCAATMTSFNPDGGSE